MGARRDRCSTGGWEALGVQVIYLTTTTAPGRSAPIPSTSDPIDRNIDEHNAYYYDNPFKRTPKPGYRDYRDHLHRPSRIAISS
jgi:hypothetical protein